MNLSRILVAASCAVATFSTAGRVAGAMEWHVATSGNDGNPGSAAAPLRSIQSGANHAQPGDVVTVHGGVYRERVNPPRGGTSESMRITYQAASGEAPEIRGSERVQGWTKDQGDVWKVSLPNAYFGNLNPYSELIHGDWFDPRGRQHHTGAVYLNGTWLTEAARLEEVMGRLGESPLWFGRVDAAQTVLWAQFPGVDPNREEVEINVRRAVFYPDTPGRNFITVRGFVLKQAATQWAPPTAEQVAVIGTHWSQGWIIESNKVSHSVCSGISLGKHGDAFDNTSADTAEGYVKTIDRALAKGWNRETIGHHIVRGNVVSHCEQAGIVGSLGAAFSTVSGNVIHDIHVRRLFSGAEMAGIKFHAAIDTVIEGNHIYRTVRGLWLDWMAQGTRVSGNLFHENAAEDLFVEVDHGPFMVDNNLFLSGVNLLDMSEGGAYAHNLFTGKIISRPEPNRETPYHPAHTTKVGGLARIKGGDNRYFNNVFVGVGNTSSVPGKGEAKDANHAAGYGLWVYDDREFPSQVGGNVYLFGARAYRTEPDATVLMNSDPQVKLSESGGRFSVQWNWDGSMGKAPTRLVATEMLGEARIPRVRYEAADGSALQINRDFLGKPRSSDRPGPGPFVEPGTGLQKIVVW